MAENVPQSIEVPVALELFGSLVTEMSPSDLPEGMSPDNQDVVYLPGSVGSRPGMKKIYAGLPAGTTITYEKTFTPPNGIPLNLLLASNGDFLVENSLTPGVFTKIADITPGSYCSSVSAFGRELLTFHNNQSGTDVPRTYDGVFFDRATQGGPGAPPILSNLALPTVNLVPAPVPPAVAVISTTFEARIDVPFTSYSGLILNVAAHGFSIGDVVVVTGNSNPLSNGTFTVTGTTPTAIGISGFTSSTDPSGVGGLVSGVVTGAVLTRTGNSVSGSTATAHGLNIGNQVVIAGMDATPIGGGIVSVVVNNENDPGLAVITTTNPHGLLPGNNVTLSDILPQVVGGGIQSYSITPGMALVTTNTPHGLSIGSQIQISLGPLGDILTHYVDTVPSDTTFTISTPENTSSSTGTTGTLLYVFPLSTQNTSFNNFDVVGVPSDTTFTVAISYLDGEWNSGQVLFSWNGNFFITAVPNPTTFAYQQSGPNAVGTGSGTLTPFGQIAPGTRNCVCLFLTRNGLVTAPSPPSVPFVSDGGKYMVINQIPIGPANVIARILAFTGADGGNYFYIPTPVQVNGLTIATSTVINDNFTASAVFDFSDNSLFSGIAIDISGNNLFALQTLGPALGVMSYASRAGWYGMKNSLQNFINFGFEGGQLSGNPDRPLGWTVSTFGGTLSTAHSDAGAAWQITGTGTGLAVGQLTQSAYQDPYRIAIVQPSTTYAMNVWAALVSSVGGTAGNLIFDLYSPTFGVLATASIPINTLQTDGKFFTVNFNAQLPAVIPSDTLFRVYEVGLGLNSVIVVDEMEIYPIANPTVPVILFSYINKPEALDGVTGFLGATDDDTDVMAHFTYRNTLLFLSQSGLHSTVDLAGLEPSGWRVKEESDHSGCVSPRACSTGENFSVWVTSPSANPPVGRGLYVYTGGAVYKLSQEIQPDFDSFNLAAQSSIWVKNDPILRRIYIGAPVGAATAPSKIYVLDYRELDTASDLASKGPIHVSFSGKMVCSDLSRKWTKWTIPTNFGEIITIPGIGAQFVVGGGNGQTPGVAAGFANCYRFDPTVLTDDDYGMINSYYVTYFFVNHDAESQLQVGLHRKLFKRYAAFMTGVGFFKLQPYAANLNNPWPAPPLQPLRAQQDYDFGDGLNISTERCAFKFSSQPTIGATDNSFNVGKFIVTLSQEPISPIRFGAV